MLNLQPKTKKVLIIGVITAIMFAAVLFIGGFIGNGSFNPAEWDSFGRGLIAAFFIIGFTIGLCIIIAYIYEEEVRRG